METASDQGEDYEKGYTTDGSEAGDLITKGNDHETSLDDSLSSCSERADP